MDGTDNASSRDPQDDTKLQVTSPVQGLFGVTMPQAGVLDMQSLQAAAEQLRASLLDSNEAKPPPVGMVGANSKDLQVHPAAHFQVEHTS